MNTPEDVHMADLVGVLAELEGLVLPADAFSARLSLPKVRICHCGVEMTPDMPEHIACYPGMD